MKISKFEKYLRLSSFNANKNCLILLVNDRIEQDSSNIISVRDVHSKKALLSICVTEERIIYFG